MGSRSTGGTGLVWFRRDLRLGSNPAWAAATSEHDVVVALYVLDGRLLDAAGELRRRQLLADLSALDVALRDRGGRLLVRHGDPVEVVAAEARRLGADRVHWNSDVSPYATVRDDAVAAALPVPAETTWGGLVLVPGAVVTKAGGVPRVFSAFHRRWTEIAWDPWPEPGSATVADEHGDALPDAGGDPPCPPGEAGAHETVARFLDGGVSEYDDLRDDLSSTTTSRLSVHLKFGTIAAREVAEAVGDADEGRRAFVRQLAWRDWFAHLLLETPALVDHAQRPELDGIRWRDDPGAVAAWKEGRTGFPIVDAGMRELASTGWMHNRVRMLASSFLVKDLLVDWRVGERHFRHLLVDGDVSQNVGNWQWVAGTGPDAAPYFRVFNPVTQARRHDPDGTYVRRWVPELAGLDAPAVHAPWEASPDVLAAAGVALGKDYPEPLVDHARARERAVSYLKRRSALPPTDS